MGMAQTGRSECAGRQHSSAGVCDIHLVRSAGGGGPDELAPDVFVGESPDPATVAGQDDSDDKCCASRHTARPEAKGQSPCGCTLGEAEREPERAQLTGQGARHRALADAMASERPVPRVCETCEHLRRQVASVSRDLATEQDIARKASCTVKRMKEELFHAQKLLADEGARCILQQHRIAFLEEKLQAMQPQLEGKEDELLPSTERAQPHEVCMHKQRANKERQQQSSAERDEKAGSWKESQKASTSPWEQLGASFVKLFTPRTQPEYDVISSHEDAFEDFAKQVLPPRSPEDEITRKAEDFVIRSPMSTDTGTLSASCLPTARDSLSIFGTRGRSQRIEDGQVSMDTDVSMDTIGGIGEVLHPRCKHPASLPVAPCLPPRPLRQLCPPPPTPGNKHGTAEERRNQEQANLALLQIKQLELDQVQAELAKCIDNETQPAADRFKAMSSSPPAAELEQLQEELMTRMAHETRRPSDRTPSPVRQPKKRCALQHSEG